MSSIIPNPTILFVIGSWHTPAHFDAVRDVFSKAGYETSCPALPSLGKFPPIGLKEDAQRIRDELKSLIEKEEKEVIVIAHSYGGLVSTEVLDKEFAKKERQAHGKKGGIVRLLYMCAFIVEVGQALVDPFGGGLPPFITIQEDVGQAYVNDPEFRFYHDLPEVDQKRYASLLRKIPITTQRTPITQAAYMYHPVTYLFCENDQAIPVEIQKGMVNKIRALGVDVETDTCEASHSPFLSMPEKVLQTVESIVGKL